MTDMSLSLDSNGSTSGYTLLDSPLTQAWATILKAALLIRNSPNLDRGSYGLDSRGQFDVVPRTESNHYLDWIPGTGWCASELTTGIVRDLFDLYLPLCNIHANNPMTIGHLGQSLDGFIATRGGDSMYVSGPENIVHLHRMRALCDAIIVGAETVANDNPRLTTRLVRGESPTRVVIDPRGRLSPSSTVFSDPSAPTLWIRQEHGRDTERSLPGVDVITIPTRGSTLDLEALLLELHQRGLNSVFVEGGGATVSHFVRSGLLNRLQIAVAPVVIGSGRRGVALQGDTPLKDCLRPKTRLYRMGEDMLFDLDLDCTNTKRTFDDSNSLPVK